MILFGLTMSWLVEPVKNSRLFMDDVTGTTETAPQSRHLFNATDEKLKWAGFSAIAQKV